MTAHRWCFGPFIAVLLVFFLLVSASSSRRSSSQPFWNTTVDKNLDFNVNCSETFDAVTGELIADSIVYPGVDVRKFHTVYTIPGGAISVDPDYQYVMTANMTPIPERSGTWYFGRNPAPRNLSKPIVKLYGDVVYLHMACHYWHYQYETITQLRMLSESGELARILANKSKTTLLTGSASPPYCGAPHVYESMLAYYGLDGLFSQMTLLRLDTKVTYQVVNGDLVVTANNLYLPNLPFLHHTAELAAKSRQQLQQKDTEALGTSVPPPPSRLYIDREVKYKRGIVNRDELLAGLAAFNFTLFSPANHNFTEQREAFSRASLILSPSGTAFSANVIHCDPNNTVLIEMFGKPIHTRTGIVVAAAMKARHYYAVQPDYNHNATTGDFYVNVSMVVKVIQRALSEQQQGITRMALK